MNLFKSNPVLLLLLLSRFSRVRLCATPWTAAHQASPFMGSPGKNTGVGCHFLLQCMKVESESEVPQSCLTLSDPMDCSLPGSSFHGIFQATVLEWGAIAFSQSCVTFLFSAFSAVKIGMLIGDKYKEDVTMTCKPSWKYLTIKCYNKKNVIFIFEKYKLSHSCYQKLSREMY